MIILLSPSKTMDFSSLVPDFGSAEPEFLKEASTLVPFIRNMDVSEIGRLMGISGPLAVRTKSAFMEWTEHHSNINARPCILAFAGDVYDGLKAGTLSKKEISFAQQHLIIFSGLYGLLRPLDLIMPFRLEMGIRWETELFKSLYNFWKEKVNKYFVDKMNSSGETVLLNLASHEYFKILEVKKLNARIITPSFMEQSGEKMKMVSVFAKKARGMMANFIIRNNISDPNDLIAFHEEGYHYLPRESKQDTPVFVR